MIATVTSAVRQSRWERLAFWRNPASVGFTFAFPLMFLVIFIAINGHTRVRFAHGKAEFAQYYVPAMIAFGIISVCYTNLAFTISVRRNRGVLKRTRGTPADPAAYFGGLVLNSVVTALILSALTIALGLTLYGITLPHRYLALGLTAALGAFCFGACGAAVATFIPNEDSAPAIVNLLLFALLFISGTFGTIANDSVLGRTAALFPVRHLVRQLSEVFDPTTGGSGLSVVHLAVLLSWGLFALVVAARRFRWDPPLT